MGASDNPRLSSGGIIDREEEREREREKGREDVIWCFTPFKPVWLYHGEREILHCITIDKQNQHILEIYFIFLFIQFQ